MKFWKLASAATAFILSTNVNAALVTMSYSIESIVSTYIAPGANDTYGIGINDFSSSTNVSVNYTYDNYPANATMSWQSYDFPEAWYQFNGSPFSASLNVDGNNTLSSNLLTMFLLNDLTQGPNPSAGDHQYLYDVGFPSTLTGAYDVFSVVGYSQDYNYYPKRNGLQFSIDFIDLDGDLLNSLDELPADTTIHNNVDLAFLHITQYENDVLQFEAVGNLAIDMSPVPVPAAVWLFGSGLVGLVGLVGFSRRKKY